MDFRTWVCLASIVLSGIAIVILLTQRRSMGCYTERIERTQEGTRRSNELKRQSDERLREALLDHRIEYSLIREELKAVRQAYRHLHDERSA